MLYIIFAAIFGLVILGGVLVAVFSTERFGGTVVAVVATLILVIVTAIASATQVDARSVAIETAFGHYNGTLGPGLHWIAPWASVEPFTTRLQPTKLSGNDAIEVTFSSGEGDQKVIGGGRGKFDIFIRWRIDAGLGANGARALWNDYRTFDDVTNGLVDNDTKNVTIEVANKYSASVATVKQEEIGNEIATRLKSRLSRYGVVVDSIAVTHVTLDNATQASVDKIFASTQAIRQSQNDQTRAKIDAETVRIRNASGALSPEANQRFCLDVLNNWNVDKNGPAPATLNCNLSGSGSPVIVGQAK